MTILGIGYDKISELRIKSYWNSKVLMPFRFHRYTSPASVKDSSMFPDPLKDINHTTVMS